MGNEYKTVWEFVEAHMKQVGIKNKAELARVSGINYSTVNELSHNRTKTPSGDTLIKLAKALKVLPDQIVSLSDDVNHESEVDAILQRLKDRPESHTLLKKTEKVSADKLKIIEKFVDALMDEEE